MEGTFEAVKSNVGQASTVTEAAVKGLVRARCHCVAVLPVPFALESSSDSVFEEGSNMVSSNTYKYLPSARVG